MEDELEAFMSVYGEDAELDSVPLDGFKHSIVVNVRQRGALSSSCFVEALVHMYLPSSYPDILPGVCVKRVSGLNDEGKALSEHVSNYMTTVAPGDAVLFDVMEAMMDYLDGVEGGECLICLTSLLIPPNKLPANNKSCALRTSCFHCFHIYCLTKWAAIYLSQEYVKQSNKEGVLEDRASRAMQGDIKSLERQCEKLVATISVQQDELDKIILKTKAVEENNISSVYGEVYSTFSVIELETEFDSLHSQQKFIKSRLAKNPKGKVLDNLKEELRVNAEKIVAVEGYIDQLKKEGRDEQKSYAELIKMQKELEKSIASKQDQKEKLFLRISQAKAKASETEAQVQSKQKDKIEGLIDAAFPCPCCRSPLEDCFPQDRNFFKKRMKHALLTHGEWSVSDDSTIDNKNHADNSATSAASVLMLEPELQAIVREIQRNQACLKSSLRGRHIQNKANIDNNECLTISNDGGSQLKLDDFEIVIRNKNAKKMKSQKNAKESKSGDELGQVTSDESCPIKTSTCYESFSLVNSLPDNASATFDEENDINEAIRLSLLCETETDNPRNKAASRPLSEDVYSVMFAERAHGHSLNRSKPELQLNHQHDFENELKYATKNNECKRIMASQRNYTFSTTSKVSSVKLKSTIAGKDTKACVQEKEVMCMPSECVCCGEEFHATLRLYAIGSCNHAAMCGECSLRSRLIVKDFTCAMCRHNLDVVLCTSTPGIPFKDQIKFCCNDIASFENNAKAPSSKKKKKVPVKNASCLHSDADGSSTLYYAAANIYIPKHYMNEVLSNVLHYKCKICEENLGDMANIRGIKRHLFEKHELHICDVCSMSNNRHIFASELEAYTPSELKSHMLGENVGSTGISGHPACNFCDKNFYDTDSLLQHLTDSHFCCYICEILKNGGSDSSQIEPRSYSSAITQSAYTTKIHQNEETMQSISTRTFATTEINSAMSSNYFKNKTELHDHFRKAHYCCKLCKKIREVAVFSTKSELDAHMSRSHPSSTRQNIRGYMS